MFCSGCGKLMPEGSTFCPQCGRPAGAAATPAPNPASATIAPPAPPVYVPPAPATALPVVPGLAYAGFWLRLVAYIIDSLIIGFVLGVVVLILVLTTGVLAFIRNLPNNPNPGLVFQSAMFMAFLFLAAAWIVAVWLYYAWMESSRFQGTLGKMALGLIVTDMQYRPVSFGRASGRFFARFITNLIPLFIGYIMAGFTAQKQALHDMIASCLVLRKI
ncbi:MAG TPA: RDD family protein [Candidatus Acidoferrales bacterium]|nr:RDD family protein [Candidatus Acidoferrales bacterium]